MRKNTYQTAGKNVDPIDRVIEAKQVIALLDEAIEELEGMETYDGLLVNLLARDYALHRRSRNVLDGLRKSHRHYLKRLKGLVWEYRSFVFDYEHRYGEIEIGKVPPLAPFAASIDDLLSMNDGIQIWEDFLDG